MRASWGAVARAVRPRGTMRRPWWPGPKAKPRRPTLVVRSLISPSSTLQYVRQRKTGSKEPEPGRLRSRLHVNWQAKLRTRLGSDEARMIRIILFLVSVTVIAAGFAWIADRPGEVAITWMGYR